MFCKASGYIFEQLIKHICLIESLIESFNRVFSSNSNLEMSSCTSILILDWNINGFHLENLLKFNSKFWKQT